MYLFELDIFKIRDIAIPLVYSYTLVTQWTNLNHKSVYIMQLLNLVRAVNEPYDLFLLIPIYVLVYY